MKTSQLAISMNRVQEGPISGSWTIFRRVKIVEHKNTKKVKGRDGEFGNFMFQKSMATFPANSRGIQSQLLIEIRKHRL